LADEAVAAKVNSRAGSRSEQPARRGHRHHSW